MERQSSSSWFLAEMLDDEFADLYYRYHWAVVEEPEKMDELDISPSIVIERDHALSWLLSESDWDAVQLDT